MFQISHLFCEFLTIHEFEKPKVSAHVLSLQEPEAITGCWFSKQNVDVLSKWCFYLLDVSLVIAPDNAPAAEAGNAYLLA